MEALRAALRAWGRNLEHMSPQESPWPSPAARNAEGLRSATFYGRFRQYLGKGGRQPSGLRVLGYSAAKLRRSAGESIEDMSRFLDHSSLAVTTTYLRRLEGQEDKGWGKVAEAIGLG